MPAQRWKELYVAQNSAARPQATGTAVPGTTAAPGMTCGSIHVSLGLPTLHAHCMHLPAHSTKLPPGTFRCALHSNSRAHLSRLPVLLLLACCLPLLVPPDHFVPHIHVLVTPELVQPLRQVGQHVLPGGSRSLFSCCSCCCLSTAPAGRRHWRCEQQQQNNAWQPRPTG